MKKITREKKANEQGTVAGKERSGSGEKLRGPQKIKCSWTLYYDSY